MTAPIKRNISKHLNQRVREWFRKAEHELAYLEHAPLDLEDPPTDTTGKMAHVVAEYCLKAYLVLCKRKIKKIHDLDEPLNFCIIVHQDEEFNTLRDDCEALNRYKEYLVYPAHFPITISVDEAKAAIEKARAIFAFVLRKAQELGYAQD